MQKGMEVAGTIQLDDEAAAIEELRRRGLYPTEISPVSAGTVAKPPAPPPSITSTPGILPPTSFRWQPKARELEFWEDLYMLIDSGNPVLDSLNAIADDRRHATYTVAAERMAEDVRDGFTLSEAMGRCGIFDDLAITLVKAGELGGVLEFVIKNLLERRRTEIRLRTRPWFWMFGSALAFSIMIVALVKWLRINPAWRQPVCAAFILLTIVPANWYFDIRSSQNQEMEGCIWEHSEQV